MAVAAAGAALPTLYEYYTAGGVNAGLSDAQKEFTLNNKNITIYSGAFHYFRVPRAYWRDRLRKMRAAGLNAVETYMPWNLHEPQPGVYDFGNGSTDMSDFLHLEEFLKTAQEEDLLALVRPGPYICAEWEFGGMPSWILRHTKSIRNSKDQGYLTAVKRYFNVLIPILAALQFQKGGPIIAVQIENEYANTDRSDLPYLQFIRDLLVQNGIRELLYTADSPRKGSLGAIPGVLQTANFNKNPKWQLDTLNALQPNKPTMAMEFWTGWYDHWSENHSTVATDKFKGLVETILDYPSSINMYMFVGSTNFGFMNGANVEPLGSGTNNSFYQPTTSSYDYDSPITEYGGYSGKYWAVKDLIAARNKVATKLPDVPKLKPLVSYPELKATGQLLLTDLIKQTVTKTTSEHVIPMELLPINNNTGQSYGYIAYSQQKLKIPAGAVLKISGYVRDTVLVLVNGKLVSPIPRSSDDLKRFGFWKLENSTLTLTDTDLQDASLDIIVENFGRNNFGYIEDFLQYKGLTEDVYLNDEVLLNWSITPLEFKSKSNSELKGWQAVEQTKSTPALYRFQLDINEEPQDTYVDMSNWNKGIVIVNNFVLSRYFFVGPQLSAYLPATLLRKGHNEIVVFEHYNAADTLRFVKDPIFITYSWYR